MTQSTEQLTAAALALPPDERARLADQLLASLDTAEQSEIDAAQAAEAEWRIDEYQKGNIPTVPAEEVLRPRQPVSGQ
jgi:putative addiction module component (TIGR02574 family)